MKLLTYVVGKKEMIGVLNQDETWVYPVSAAGMDYTDMKDLIREIGPSEMEMLGYIVKKEPYDVPGAAPMEDVKVLAPIPEPDQDIICLGINYAAHAEESARFTKESFAKDHEKQAIYFSKRVNRAVDPDGGISAHRDLTQQLDYEAELVVVIKKDAKNVTRENVRDYIFGYTIMNDVSAREVQTSHKQWYFGKSLDNFTPLGPWITTEDAIEYPPKLRIQSKVNGELRQDSNTELFLTDIEDVIVELSQGMTLRSGTLIATGTPSGVGMGFVPPKFLNVGDVVECIVEGIGTLKNTIVE
ncbi:MAG: fumarylacetoacetate hydrolase family protein [Lachnospiraceae bacterium]|nr:fumarylacetoacetate hydrolase family protein [Lachnospiraceae bacterium]